MNKDINHLVKLLQAQGFKVEPDESGHPEVRTAEGAYVTRLASSPSEYRGWANALSYLRNHGFEDPWKAAKPKEPKPTDPAEAKAAAKAKKAKARARAKARDQRR